MTVERYITVDLKKERERGKLGVKCLSKRRMEKIFHLLWDGDVLNNQHGNQNEEGADKIGFHHFVPFFGVLYNIETNVA